MGLIYDALYTIIVATRFLLYNSNLDGPEREFAGGYSIIATVLMPLGTMAALAAMVFLLQDDRDDGKEASAASGRGENFSTGIIMERE